MEGGELALARAPGISHISHPATLFIQEPHDVRLWGERYYNLGGHVGVPKSIFSSMFLYLQKGKQPVFNTLKIFEI